MLDAEELVFELLLLIFGLGDEFAEFIGEIEAAGAAADLELTLKVICDLSFEIGNSS